jgi:hypothetical protein
MLSIEEIGIARDIPPLLSALIDISLSCAANSASFSSPIAGSFVRLVWPSPGW